MPSQDWTIDEQDQFIAQAIERDQPRLRSFIRKRVWILATRKTFCRTFFMN